MWITGALLVIVAAVAYRVRVRRYRASELSDDLIARIENVGTIEVDEPLDLEHIRREEERFLEETAWDEPDE